MEAGAAYPVTLAVDYPERQSRWKTLLRLFLAIPVFIFAFLIFMAQGVLAWAIWIAIILRGRIPRWMFDSQVALTRWQVRALSYPALLTDAYPPFEGDYPIRFEVEYPERVSRRKVLIWKYITSMPHGFVLNFLWIGAFFSVIIGWFAILITGRFPKGLHGYVAGVIRWQMRVHAYSFSLTDVYPPFSLSAEAGPAGRDTYIVSSVIGCLLGAGYIALFVAGSIVSLNMRETVRVDVSYADLTAGRVTYYETAAEVWDVQVALTAAVDPADDVFPLLAAVKNKKLVSFQLMFDNERNRSAKVRDSDFRLKDGEGDWHDPLLMVVGGRVAPVKIAKGTPAKATVIFEIGDDARPAQLKYQPFGEGRRVIYEFE